MKLHPTSPAMLGIRPVKNPFVVRLNTEHHSDPLLYTRHGQTAEVIGINYRSAVPACGFRVHIRFSDGQETVTFSDYLTPLDNPRVPDTHRQHPNAFAAWLWVTAAQEAHVGDFYSSRYNPDGSPKEIAP